MTQAPSNERLKKAIPKVAAWADRFGVDVPVHNGEPILGHDLDTWINNHIHYSSATSTNAIENASIGFAFSLRWAELEGGFTWGNNGDNH